MDGQSLTPDKAELQQLKDFMPDAFSGGKIDWEKLKAMLDEDITFSNERYMFSWAGMSDAFKIMQTPSTLTLINNTLLVRDAGVELKRYSNADR